MAKVLGGRQTVPLEEVVRAKAFQLEALLNVLERQGVVRKAEVWEEMTRPTEKSVTFMRSHRECAPPNFVAQLTRKFLQLPPHAFLGHPSNRP